MIRFLPKLSYWLNLLIILLALSAQAPNETSKLLPEDQSPKPALTDKIKNKIKNFLPDKTNENINSIMMSNQELENLQKALDAYENNISYNSDALGADGEVKEIKAEDNIKSYIYLNSILYHSPNNWYGLMIKKYPLGKINSDQNYISGQ
jgi:uncharacterized protein YpmS